MCAVLLGAGVDMSEDSEFFDALNRSIERNIKGEINMRQSIRCISEAVLPPNAPSLINGRVHIVTVEASGSVMAWRKRKPTVFDHFDSNDDISDAVGTSTHIPYVVNGEKTVTYRGARYVDIGVVGTMFHVVDDAVNVNILPNRSDVAALAREPWPVKTYLQFVSGLVNKADAPVHAHPWLADGWLLTKHVTSRDLLMRPVPRGVHLERHRLGQEAFHVWSKGRHSA